MLKKTLFLYFFLITCFSLLSQDLQVITRNHPQGGIEIKWYSRQLIYQGGVHVYRKEEGKEWQQLTTRPIQKEASLTDEVKKKEEDLALWETVVNENGYQQLEPILYIQVMGRSFMSSAFAQFLGVRYVDPTAQKGKSYQYKITSQNKRFSGISTAITTGPYQKEKAPANTDIKARKKKVLIDWKVDEKHFFSYNIFRSILGSDEYIKLNDGPVIPTLNEKEEYPEFLYEDDSLQRNTNYQYYVEGINFFGDTSLPSEILNVFFADSVPPIAPTAIQLDTIDHYQLNVTVSWKTSPSKDLKGFKIYRVDGRDTVYKPISKILPLIQSSYEDKLDEAGVYRYKVSAVDSSGNEALSYPMMADVKDILPPAAPKGLIAIPDTGFIHLQWQANAEPDLKGYQIIRSIKGANEYMVVNSRAMDTTRFTQRLPKNARNEFTFRIIAIDTMGNKSTPSAIAMTQQPDIIPPQAPIIKSIQEQEGKLVVYWYPNTEPDLEGYEVYRAEGSDSATFKQVNFNTLGSFVNRYTDTRVQKGITYYYYLQATDVNNLYSKPSKIRSAKLSSLDSKLKGARNIQTKLTKRGKLLTIRWDKAKEKVNGYTVFKKQENTQLYKPISGLLTTKTDFSEKVNPEFTHIYQLRTYYPNGQIVRSKEIVVEKKK